jgi:hypothetical protein
MVRTGVSRMAEDYVVTANTPIPALSEQDFAFGWQFGYQDEDGSFHYWDGQDIWLAPGLTRLRAIFKGTLHFVSSWQSIRPDSQGAANVEYPVVGDALILRIWPKDFFELKELLPEGALTPKEIIYQNVDREAVRDRARFLIRRTRGYGPDQASDADIDRILTDWLAGRGADIQVQTGDDIGVAGLVGNIPPRPDSVPSIPVEHTIPVGVNVATWPRLTLKVISDGQLYFSPSFLFYLMENARSPQWERPRRSSNLFVARCCDQIEALPVISITHQRREGWMDGDEPDEDMPSALPNVTLLIRQVGLDQAVPILFDPTLDRLWRAQGRLYEGQHQWRFLGPQLYAQCLPDQPFSQARNVEPQPPTVPTLLLGVHTAHWLTFDLPNGTLEKRYLLGINMEACRRKLNHDLSGHDIHFEYADDGAGPTLKYTRAWLDDNTNKDALRRDLENIARTGARAVRVWVFENFEGLHLACAQQLLEQRRRADQSNNPNLFRRIVAGRVFHVCTADEFARLKQDLRLAVEPANVNSNPLWNKLVNNAQFLQEAAASVNLNGSSCGLRVLWTLWVHYGEGVLPARWGWRRFIPEVSTPESGAGRLPVEAWIYRELIVDSVFRDSYIEHAVKPFVRAMETAGGETIGYEAMNEPDFVWSGCRHTWTRWIDGTASLPTRWRMTETHLRTFVRECAEAVRTVLGEVGHEEYRTGHPGKLIISGIQTTFAGRPPGHSYVDDVQHEIELLRPGHEALDPPDPPLALSATALTRYASPVNWERTNPEGRESEDITLPVPVHPFLQNYPNPGPGICLFSEAGGEKFEGLGYDCMLQVRTVRQLLTHALRNSYAGLFLWHYNDPERQLELAANYSEQNALSEGGRWVGNAFIPWGPTPHDDTDPEHYEHVGGRFPEARPVCDVIWDWANEHSNLLLPYL